MSKTKHTPGPWFRSDEDNQIRANTQEGQTTICEMWSTDDDALLIAAAPENLLHHELLLIEAQAVLEGAVFAREKLALQIERSKAAIGKAKPPLANE